MRENIIVGTMKERVKEMVKATVGGRETKVTMVDMVMGREVMGREVKATLVDMAKATTVDMVKEMEAKEMVAKAAMVDPEVISAIVT